jgi:hypothetical protein
MICERISECDFIADVSLIMPVTAIMIKSMYCKNVANGCAKYHECEIIAIDKEKGSLHPGLKINKVELFDKKYSEFYQKLCVRYRKETTVNHKIMGFNSM